MDKSEIQKIIKELIEKMTIAVNGISVDEEAPASVQKDDGSTIWFGVEVGHPHFFWERGGEGLFALNHLVRKIIESNNKISGKSEEESAFENRKQGGLGILVDINGFQKKRIENIHSIAHTMAERARYFKSSIEIDPMPAFERRIVHEFLAGVADIKTESQGEGSSRRVVIKYIGTI